MLYPVSNGRQLVLQSCKDGMYSQHSISTQSSSVHVEERDQELWGTLEQDCL